jgi:hypothetical protein
VSGGCGEFGEPLGATDGGVDYGYVSDMAAVLTGPLTGSIAFVANVEAYLWSKANGIKPLDCGQAPNRIATDGEFAYCVGSSNVISRGRLDGTTPAGGVGDAAGDRSGDVTVASGRFYWTSFNAGQQGIVSSNTSAKTDPRSYTPSGIEPVAVTGDATRVYWLTYGGGQAIDARGELRSCPIAGCNNVPDILVQGIAGPLDIAVDEAAIYVGYKNGIFKIAKP